MDKKTNTPIGGYFELELDQSEKIHRNAIQLNSGRHALKYILESRGFARIFLPSYTCDAVLQPISDLGIRCQFYDIQEDFRPVFDFGALHQDDGFITTNYFGLTGQIVNETIKKCPNVIVDNAQAFYSEPEAGIDTFYSPRKFFGLPDGGLLYTDKLLNRKFEEDQSYERCEHLLRRVDVSPESGYPYFTANSSVISALPIRKMSKLTERLMGSINYSKIAEIRRRNFRYLEDHLGTINKLNMPLDDNAVPLVYPFFSESDGLRQYLIERHIYVALYWHNVLDWAEEGSVAHNYAKNIVHLPIDQRYGEKEMKRVIQAVNEFLRK